VADLRPSAGDGFAVATLAEIAEITDGRLPWRPVGHHLGITAFGVSAWSAAAAGDRVINEHDEAGDAEELYLVHRGRATFELAGERIDAPAGTVVVVPPGVLRTAFADEPGTTILAVGATPGEAYEPDGWELLAPVARVYQAGSHEQAIDAGRAIVEANPQFPMLAYVLAVWEAQAGRTQDALDHLRAAVASPRVRRLAARDVHLDPLRGEPAFGDLVGSGSSSAGSGSDGPRRSTLL
jgi:mannose-6-phosphate isomerase-like protein (cupin superfamily)